jgi:hypothetical protein
MKKITLSSYLMDVDFALSQLYFAYRHYKVSLREMVDTSSHIGESLSKGRRLRKATFIKNRNQAKDYFSLKYSQAIVSGAILQIAYMAIEKFSKNDSVPEKYDYFNIRSDKVKLFCIGNEIKTIPKGLLIYAGRNLKW